MDRGNDLLIDQALKSIGLVFWRHPMSGDVYVFDKSGKILYDAYDENYVWICTNASSVKNLGKTRKFIQECSIPSQTTASNYIIDNPFFGVKTATEIRVKLDLME